MLDRHVKKVCLRYWHLIRMGRLFSLFVYLPRKIVREPKGRYAFSIYIEIVTIDQNDVKGVAQLDQLIDPRPVTDSGYQ